MARLRVGDDLAGQRLDHGVVAAIPGLTVNAARRLIAAGQVRVDGRRPRKGERLANGQLLEIDEAGQAAQGAAAEVLPDGGLAIDVLYADQALVAVDKPPGIPSHPLQAGELGTAANAIVARFPECAGASPDPREGGLVHRLDNDTSGVLLAARSREAWAALRAALSAPTCEKTYWAEVTGDPAEAGTSTAAIGRVGRRGGRVRLDGGRRPLPARTDWRVLERRAATALLEVRLHAGRAHQVRAHLAAVGLPIVGDPTYGDSPEAVAGAPPRLHLHAASIAFPHPLTGAAVLINAPPPPWAMMRA